ncbi:MAG: hypothetical protein ACLGHN_06565 [Bacteriovoracia bacterium]
MKFLTLFFLLASVAHAWEIQHEKNQTFLHDKALKKPVKIIAHPEKTEISAREISDGVTLITYLESIGGTTSLNKIYNCAVYSRKSGKVVFKNKVCKVLRAADKGTEVEREAHIEVKDGKVHYVFEELKDSYSL